MEIIRKLRGIVGLAERCRRFDELSASRLALWGFGAGALFIGVANWILAREGGPPFDLSTVTWTAFYGALGAGIGAGTYWLARRASRDTSSSRPSPLGEPAL